MFLTLLILNKIIVISAIWPVPYKIDLQQSEEFIIDEHFNNENVVALEDEMIQQEEIEKFDLDEVNHKYDLLHKLVKRYNDRENEKTNYLKDLYKKIPEDNTDDYYDEIEPKVAGFIDENKHFIINNDKGQVYYLNKITKRLTASKISKKREDTPTDYNYDELFKEYNMEIEQEVEMDEVFNSTFEDETESVKEALNLMVDFKTPKNCTAEEQEGIGYGAAKCAWMDFQDSKTPERKMALLHRIKKFLIVWFSIYFIIVIPLWLHKGWCCCCCRCKFCKPRERIDEAKKYYVDNPPGVLLAKKEEPTNYEPSIYEIDEYLKLERMLMNL